MSAPGGHGGGGVPPGRALAPLPHPALPAQHSPPGCWAVPAGGLSRKPGRRRPVLTVGRQGPCILLGTATFQSPGQEGQGDGGASYTSAGVTRVSHRAGERAREVRPPQARGEGLLLRSPSCWLCETEGAPAGCPQPRSRLVLRACCKAAAGQGGLADHVTPPPPAPRDPHVASREAETNPQICHWEPFSARDFKGGSRAGGGGGCFS